MKGYYSLVQYCPDTSRLEAINVGLVLFCPETGFLSAKTLQTNNRVTRFFEHVSQPALDAAKESLVAKLIHVKERIQTLEDLQGFANSRANDLRLTPPRPVKVVDPERDLLTLLVELVGEEHSTPRRPRAKFPVLESLFERLVSEGRATSKYKTHVPVTDKEYTVPYAYLNGLQKLIQPQLFGPIDTKAFRAAEHFATTGRLLAKYPEAGLQRRLVVVPKIAEGSPVELSDKLGELFFAHDVEYVRDLPAFIEKVDVEAHAAS